MSANTHANIDSGAQRTHETVDAAANTIHSMANQPARAYDATAESASRTRDAAVDGSYRAQATAQDASYQAKSALNDASYQARSTANDASYQARSTANDLSNKAGNAADHAAARTNQAARDTRETAAHAANQTRDAAATAADKTREAANTASAKTSEAIQNAQETSRRLSSAASARVSHLAEVTAHHPLVQQTSQASQRQLNALDRELSKYGFLNEFEARTNVPKTYGVLGLGTTLGGLILLNLFGLAQPITNLVGWALPTYLSCRALESPAHGDDKQWLTYWIIFGLLNLVESAALRVVLYYIPQYFTIKLAFLIWLLYPGANNAQKVYYSLVRPLFQTGRAKASQVASNSSTGYGRTNTLNTPNSANYVNPSTGFSSAGTTNSNTTSDSTGYSSGTNPFVASSAGGASGLQQRDVQQQQTIGVVPVAVVPL